MLTSHALDGGRERRRVHGKMEGYNVGNDVIWNGNLVQPLRLVEVCCYVVPELV